MAAASRATTFAKGTWPAILAAIRDTDVSIMRALNHLGQHITLLRRNCRAKERLSSAEKIRQRPEEQSRDGANLTCKSLRRLLYFKTVLCNHRLC